MEQFLWKQVENEQSADSHSNKTGERLNDGASATWRREAELLSPVEAEEAVGEVAGG